MQQSLASYMAGGAATKKGSQTPRPYQVECVNTVLQSICPVFGDGLHSVMYAAATGSGKTTIFAEMVLRLLEQDAANRILVIAHRVELISQAYKRIKDHCGLQEWEIGQEIAEAKADVNCRVIVGSVQTCYRPGRPDPAWRPSHIITDESHHSAAKTSYGSIYDRYGVGTDGGAIHIGCTATAKRTDNMSLYAEKSDGTPVKLKIKGKPERNATYADSVFQRLVYEYTPLDAMNDGWLVEPKVFTVKTDTDLTKVKTQSGDFQQGALQKAVDNGKRTLEVISAWKRDVDHLPTLVFCAGVEHAHHAADLWRQAGYTAVAIDGETDSFVRAQALLDFASGKVQVLTNFGVMTEGTDLPNCACIVNLRPTQSWSLFVQMNGRGLRPLPGVLDGMEEATAEERRAAIAASKKGYCAIVDVVDIYQGHGGLCSAPAILDMPVGLEMQGHSLLEAKKMLDEFEEVRERVIGECPVTYEELEARLVQVSSMLNSGAKTTQKWLATADGYRYTKVPPQCRCDLIGDGDGFRLIVDAYGKRLIDRVGKRDRPIKDYLDYAAQKAEAAIDEYKQSIPKQSKGTLAWAKDRTPGWLRMMRKSFSDNAIDAMPTKQFCTIAKKLADEYFGNKEASV